jgi:hypothetical protein
VRAGKRFLKDALGQDSSKLAAELSTGVHIAGWLELASRFVGGGLNQRRRRLLAD